MKMVRFYGKEFPLEEVLYEIVMSPFGSLFNSRGQRLDWFETYKNYMSSPEYEGDRGFEAKFARRMIEGELDYLKTVLGSPNPEVDWRGEFTHGSRAALIFGRKPEDRNEAAEQRWSLFCSSTAQKKLKESLGICDELMDLFDIDEPKELGEYREFLLKNCS